MRAASVVVGAMMCPVSGSITRLPEAKGNSLRESSGGFFSDSQRSTAAATKFMGELARKVAGSNYKATDLDLDTVKSIKDFISDIEAQAVTQHEADVQLLQSTIDQIAKCGLIPQQTRNSHNQTKQDCEKREKKHDECRVVESKLHAEMSAACKEYRDYRMHEVKSLSNDCMPQHMLAAHISADRTTKPRKLENMEHCMVHSGKWLFPLHELYLKCKKHQADHNAVRENCTAGQEEFEGCVCDYRAHMISGCEAHHDCHEEKVSEHDVIEKGVRARVPARKADHVAGEKINCYFRVIEASQAEKQTILTQCESLDPDTSHFAITYPVVPAIENCTLPPAPCNDDWRKEHYLSLPWNTGAPVSQCHKCSASADPSHATLKLKWSPPTPAPARGPCECYDPAQAAWCNPTFAEYFVKAGDEGSRCYDTVVGGTKWCYFSMDCDVTGSKVSTEGKCKYKHGMSEAECAYDPSMATTPPPGGY